jgi:hypothetical protein
MVALGVRCDCGGGCIDLGLDFGPTPGKHGATCLINGCGYGQCEQSLECCVTDFTRGKGGTLCSNADECVPGAFGDPCDNWSDSVTCEEPYTCDGVCDCGHPCSNPTPFTCVLDETTCALVCCAVPCGDAGTCGTSIRDGGPPDGRDGGQVTDATGDGGGDAPGDRDGSVGDGGEGADAAPADTNGDVSDGDVTDDAAAAVDA